MSAPMRALGVDYDGTLATEGPPAAAVLATLDVARRRGLRVVIVTGRILDELREVFPGVDDHADAIVAENGAVVTDGGDHRRLAEPVDPELDAALAAGGATFRRGEVLIATTAEHEALLASAIRRLGLDHQLVRNRGELMVLPAGVTKATGLLEALADLGVSRHDVVAVGDAENDLALLAVAEVGAAVANAVDSVRARADVVLRSADGEGVRELLAEPFFGRIRERQSPRRQVVVGHDQRGHAVRMPTSANILVTGQAGSGKSYVAGLIAEQLIRAEYSLLIVDPEGDYHDLRSVPNVVTVGGDGPLPSPGELLELFHRRSTSVVVDLSSHDHAARQRFLADVPPVVQTHRIVTGVPHWILVDEAHEALGWEGAALPFFRREVTGFILVSYEPRRLADEVLGSVQFEVLLPGTARAPAEGEDPRGAEPPRVVVLPRDGEPVLVHLVPRHTGHIRHWHKYLAGQIPPAQRFYWRSEPDESLGWAATNLTEFHRQLTRVDASAVRHHACGHDFSRWFRGVLGDAVLAARALEIESRLHPSDAVEVVDAARTALLKAIEDRYLD